MACTGWVIVEEAFDGEILKAKSPVKAIVIHSRPYGEGREIVEFLTDSLGKIAGVRRLSKRYGFQRLQPFAVGLLESRLTPAIFPKLSVRNSTISLPSP